jgi:hypothetical protein
LGKAESLSLPFRRVGHRHWIAVSRGIGIVRLRLGIKLKALVPKGIKMKVLVPGPIPRVLVTRAFKLNK